MAAHSIPILLVDDELKDLFTLESMLGDLDQLEIVSCTSGDQALRHLKNREFALILLDVHMPKMNGFEIATQIRANPLTSHIPIILLTASSREDFQFQGYESGAVDYLIKPIEPLMLRNKVEVFAKLYRPQHTLLDNNQYMTHVEELLAKRTSSLERQGYKLQVLIVDDRLENLLVLEAILEELTDVTLIRATSGEEALRAVLQNDISLILLDVQMPGMDGFEVAKRLHSNAVTSQISIIFITAGMSQYSAQLYGYELGAIDYMIKPIEPTIVKSKIRVFCDLCRQRDIIQQQKKFLGVLSASRAAALQHATTELNENLERYKHLAETQELATRAAELGIWDWNAASNHQVWTDRVYELFGISRDQFDGTTESWLQYVHPEDQPRCRTALKLALKNQQNFNIEFRIVLPDGSIRHLKNHGMVSFDEHGNALRMTGVNYDITERKRAEEEIFQLTKNLEQRVKEKTEQLSLAMEQIFESEKLASLGGIVAGVSHELNTPIGNIVLAASTIQEMLMTLFENIEQKKLTLSQLQHTIADCNSASELLLRNANRSKKLIESFKNIAINQTSKSKRLFNLRQTVNDVLTTQGAALKSVKVRTEVRIAAELTLDSYPGDIEQILTNLILNSIRHGFDGKDGGQIMIGAERQNDKVHISYQDNGIGIAPELHRKIFEPFYTTKFGQGGSGLGLFIVHNLIRGTLKGDISLESESGKGVLFRLIIPAVLTN
ncbi:MAG: response regulator [Undibacterium curvum]|uniref:response regulator n=1 Tax=Undibacterium curvum TaxID=2762294 RepID=UPI003BEC2BB3